MSHYQALAIIAAVIRETKGGYTIPEAVEEAQKYLEAAAAYAGTT